MRKLALILIFFIVAPLAALSQNPAKWSLQASAGDEKISPGDKFDVKLHADIEPGWHLYALDQPPGGPIATTIKIAEGFPFEIVGSITSPQPKKAADQNFIVGGQPLETKYFVDSVDFS